MPCRVPIPGSAFAPVIVFIPCSTTECKLQHDTQWLPRQCPSCGQFAIIGHGRRIRQAHDHIHDSIRVRRGLCNHCHRTLTVLPAWCVPSSCYSLPARQQACDRLAAGNPLEQAVPHCRHPDRLPDPSTLRRWAWRRIQSLGFCAALSWRWFCAPTLLAWDWRAVVRILIPEFTVP